MFSLDMRTAIFSFVLLSIISTFVFSLLLIQYRNRFKGVRYMLSCFILQILALILILLRGNIPGWISFDISNTLSAVGIVLFLIGLEAYAEQKSTLKLNIILVFAFAAVHAWFTFGSPDIAARHLNVAVFWLIIFSQCSWLLLHRVPDARLTRPVNLVCITFCVISLIRIVKFFLFGHKAEDYFNSDGFDTAIIIVSQILLILLIFSLQHMFGLQLIKFIKIEEEKFSKAFHTSPYGLAITSMSDGRILEINDGAIRITGYSLNEVIGKTTRNINFWQNIDERSQIIDELKRCGKLSERELTFRKKSGEEFPALVSCEIISVNNERCMLSSFEDITLRKKHEAELLIAKEKAEESDKLKTAFLHNISHEIRTPMNAIVGFSALLGEPGISDANRESYVHMIAQSSDHLLTLLNDIVEISNLEAGILSRKLSNFSLNTLLNDLFRQFEHKSLKKGIRFTVLPGLPDTESFIMADRTKLFQILSNLLNNAFKFTDYGKIGMGYTLNNDLLRFCVSDTGIGIPGDSQSKIFDRFYQVDYSRTRTYEGLGLGLSIIKSYVEFLGGKIWVDSEPGRGSSFFFTMPYRKGESPVVPEEIPVALDSYDLSEKTILIAEDIESNYYILAEFLSSTNAKLLHASDGNEAVSICRSGKKIDLVLMDIKMPLMDGIEASGIISELLPGIPVIAQTAYAYEAEKMSILSKGFIDYITKPYRKTELLEIVKKYLQ